jgi:Na+/H+ antiporter NhaD/arsenite permease-like protein
MASNIGGAATLIGDPPNIMIGGATGLSFVDFVVNLLPLMFIVFVVTILILKMVFKKTFKVDEEDRLKILSFNEKKAITNKRLLIKSLIVLGLTILGFILSEWIKVESATIALTAASLLLILSKIEPEEVLEKVEWTTIFFFMGLFILVAALENIGIIEMIGNKLLDITQGNISYMTMLVLWISTFLSSFLDNIPYVATMIPLIDNISNSAVHVYEPVWWALSIGACLGGTGTIIGASANVVARGITEKHGYKITFLGYMKVAFPLMILSIAIASVYLLVVYL